MNDDDDRTRRDRGFRGSRPFGASRSRGGFGDGLFDRVLRDVASWFDEDEAGAGRDRTDVPGRREPGRGPRHEDRPDVRAGDAADVAGGRPTPVREHAVVPDDGYDDEDRVGSHRGRGPRGYRRTDERLTELVADALHDDHEVDASGIEVSVSGGDVTLSGSTSTRRHKHRAENVAARVSGVHDVDNRLRVRREGGATRGGASATSGSAGATGAGGLPGDAARDADDYGHP